MTSAFDDFDGLKHITEQLRETLAAVNTSNFAHLMEDIRKASDAQLKIPSAIIDNAVLRDMESITALGEIYLRENSCIFQQCKIRRLNTNCVKGLRKGL